MTPEFIAFKEWMSVSEAMAWLRKTRPSIATTDRVYIVDMWDRLTGAAAMSDLIMAEPDSSHARRDGLKAHLCGAGAPARRNALG